MDRQIEALSREHCWLRDGAIAKRWAGKKFESTSCRDSLNKSATAVVDSICLLLSAGAFSRHG